jgi:hypothetical protein
VTAGSTMGADEPGDDAIAQLARHHGLDPLTPRAATTQYLDQAIEHIARSYLTADPAELTEEVRLHVAWVRRLLNSSRAPAQHHRLYVRLGYLTSILAQLSLAQGDHDATHAHCAAAMRAADAAGDGQLRAWILSIHAMLAAYTNRHQDVIDLTNAGLAAAGQQASATAVKLASLQARAHANLGNRVAAETALARARETMSRVSPQQQERGLFAFPEEKLASHEGQIWLQLAPQIAPRSPCSEPCVCSTAPPVRAGHRLIRQWSAFIWLDPMPSLANSIKHASGLRRRWPSIASVRSTTPGVAPRSLPDSSSRTASPRRPRRSSTSSPRSSGSAIWLPALGIQTQLESLAPHLSAGRRSAAEQSSVRHHPS